MKKSVAQQLRELGMTEYQIQYTRTCFKIPFRKVLRVEKFWDYKYGETFRFYMDRNDEIREISLPGWVR